MDMGKRLAVSAMITGLAMATPALGQDDGFAEQVSHGRLLAQTNCAQCHAIDADDQSAHEEAPAFRTLLQRYPIDALEEGFAQSIVTGHPDMPEFLATPEQIDAIISYIEFIQD